MTTGLTLPNSALWPHGDTLQFSRKKLNFPNIKAEAAEMTV